MALKPKLQRIVSMLARVALKGEGVAEVEADYGAESDYEHEHEDEDEGGAAPEPIDGEEGPQR